jgi:hypothetical protein
MQGASTASGNVVVNTTTSLVIDLLVAWGTASLSNTITGVMFMLEPLN